MVQTLTYYYTDSRNAMSITAWFDGTAAINRLTVTSCNRVESPFGVWADSSTVAEDGKGCNKKRKHYETHGSSSQRFWYVGSG